MRCKHCNQEITKKRTSKQNRALHLWYTQLAEALNEAGFDIRRTIKEDFDIPWSPLTVKEYLWRPIQKIYMKEHSTKRLKTKDIDVIYDIINREIGQRTGIDVPMFPSIDMLMEKEMIASNIN